MVWGFGSVNYYSYLCTDALEFRGKESIRQVGVYSLKDYLNLNHYKDITII